jgi:N utilization substance protein B
MAATGRHAARRLLLQALYQFQLAGATLAELKEQFETRPGFARADAGYFAELLERVIACTAELDAEIDASGEIPGNQLDPVERAILWLAIAELRYQPDVPGKVVINEAVDLAQEFGAEGGYRYVNGVLNHAHGRLRGAAA